MPFLKLNFQKISLEQEATLIFDRRNVLSAEDKLRTNSIIRVALPASLISKIKSASNFDEIKDELVEFLKGVEPKDTVTDEDIQKVWTKYARLFFSELTKITEGKLAFGEYACLLCFSVAGHYVEGTNKFYSSSDMRPQKIIEVAMEELLHLHYWSIVKKVLNIKDVSTFNRETNRMPWKISEVIPDYILVENPAFKSAGLFAKTNRSKGYPWIPEIRKIIDPLWKKRKSFEDFILIAHK